MLTLWQTEWCPASRRVRQRLTELGLSYVVRQVPVDREERHELAAATGARTIPVLEAGPDVLVGEDSIFDFLAARFSEPPEGGAHREKAAKARRRELEEACSQLTPATH